MVTSIKPALNGRIVFNYVRGGQDEKGHNGHETRNVIIGSLNMLPDEVVSFEDQMQTYWDRAATGHIYQLRTYVFSASDKELPKDDPNSPYILEQMIRDYFTENFTNEGDIRQVAYFIQHDGDGGFWHGHALQNDCDMSTKSKGVCVEKQKHYFLKKKFDEIASRYFELDRGRSRGKKYANTFERAIDTVEGKKDTYQWKNDMFDRLRIALDEAVSVEDFIEKASECGVQVELVEFEKGKKLNGNAKFIPKQIKPGEEWTKYFKYTLTDLSGFNGGKLPNIGNLSFKSDGGKRERPSDLTYDSVIQQIQINKEMAEEIARQQLQQDDEIDQELEQDSDEDISSVSLFSLIMNDISESDDEETDNVEETDEWQNSPHNVPVVPESLPEEILQVAPEEHLDSTKPISFLTKHDIYKQVMMDADDDLKDTGKSADEIDDIMSGLDGFDDDFDDFD